MRVASSQVLTSLAYRALGQSTERASGQELWPVLAFRVSHSLQPSAK